MIVRVRLDEVVLKLFGATASWPNDVAPYFLVSLEVRMDSNQGNITEREGSIHLTS